MSGRRSEGTAGAQVLDRSRVPAAGPLRPSHFPAVERSELSSAVPVFVAPTPGLPVVTVSVLLEAGGVHEPDHRAGLASLTASLLESGAGDRGAAAIAEELETLGVQLGVGAGWDLTHLTLTGIHSRIPAAMAILRDLVREPRFVEDEVERLRGQQLAGILQRRAEPRALANEMAHRFIFSAGSPFVRPLSGTRATVQTLSRADVLAFHAARYAPGGAAVLVAGDVEMDEALDLASRAFGDWVGPALEPSTAEVGQRSEERQVVVIDRPGSVQSEIRVGHLGVPRSAEDYFAVLVMNTILGGAFSSRLNLNLREKHGFTYGVSSSFVMRRAAGPFLVSTAVQSEVTGGALGEIMREIDGIREAVVSSGELTDARNYIAGTFPLGLQTTSGVASRLSEIVAHDLPLDYFDAYRDRILEVDADAVLAAARRRVRPEAAAIVVVGDAESVAPQLRDLELGEVRVMKPEEVG